MSSSSGLAVQDHINTLTMTPGSAASAQDQVQLSGLYAELSSFQQQLSQMQVATAQGATSAPTTAVVPETSAEKAKFVACGRLQIRQGGPRSRRPARRSLHVDLGDASVTIGGGGTDDGGRPRHHDRGAEVVEFGRLRIRQVMVGVPGQPDFALLT